MLIRHLWQLKTSVLLHLCLICALLFALNIGTEHFLNFKILLEGATEKVYKFAIQVSCNYVRQLSTTCHFFQLQNGFVMLDKDSKQNHFFTLFHNKFFLLTFTVLPSIIKHYQTKCSIKMIVLNLVE